MSISSPTSLSNDYNNAKLRVTNAFKKVQILKNTGILTNDRPYMPGSQRKNAATPSGNNRFVVRMPQNNGHLGYGVYANVFSGNGYFTPRFKTAEKVAIKFNNFKEDSEIDIATTFMLWKEGALYHPHIAEIKGFVNHWHMVMAQYQDSLDKKITSATAEQKMKYAHQICNAISFWRDKDIFHNDTHTGNFMIDQDDNIRLIDFGMVTKNQSKERGLIDFQPERKMLLTYTRPKFRHRDTYIEKAMKAVYTITSTGSPFFEGLDIKNHPVCCLKKLISRSDHTNHKLIDDILEDERKLLVCHLVKKYGENRLKSALEQWVKHPLERGWENFMLSRNIRIYASDENMKNTNMIAARIRSNFKKLHLSISTQ